jgi:hypothetical protein
MREEDFFRRFDMQVHASHRKLRRIPNMYQYANAWNYSISDSAMYQHTAMPIEEVECVEVLMPKDRLQHIIDYINEADRQVEKYASDQYWMARYEQDRCVRLNNPAVEKAYQRYATLLELARK